MLPRLYYYFVLDIRQAQAECVANKNKIQLDHEVHEEHEENKKRYEKVNLKSLVIAVITRLDPKAAPG